MTYDKSRDPRIITAPRVVAERKPKRYGWYREYEQDMTEPVWRLIARTSGRPLAEVHAVRSAINRCASMARRHGWIGDFDADECAEMLDLELQHVTAILSAMHEREWLAEGYIVNWSDRNPDQEDPTMAERQRRRRARMKVRKKLAMGQTITEAEGALLSRVTGPGTDMVKPPTRGGPLVITEPLDDSPEAINAATISTAKNAQLYLLGGGTGTPADFGYASKVVADKMGMRRMAADTTIRGWLSLMNGDVTALAKMIDAADHGRMIGEAFEQVVKTGIKRYIAEATKGPELPLGPAVVQGGRRA
ncbi:MAG: hypothetical protein AB7F39_06750 [Variibacter sp.]